MEADEKSIIKQSKLRSHLHGPAQMTPVLLSVDCVRQSHHWGNPWKFSVIVSSLSTYLP